jgi:polyferredoxin
MGRLWCGWGCWTAMVLDLLPFKRSPGRLPGRWGWLRYAHFALSFVVVFVAWAFFGLGYEQYSLTALLWLAGGNAAYYAVAIGLAYALKDNRAFCKYVCPVTVPLKLTARFSALKLAGDAARCTGCEACTKLCPMDIRVHEYTRAGQRVLSTECILCQSCVTACAKQAIQLNFGLDVGGDEKLQVRAAARPKAA